MASVVFGALGLFLVAPSVLAVVCGHVGWARVARRPLELKGKGLAVAGMVMGYAVLAFVAMTGPVLWGIQKKGNRARETHQMKQM